MMQFGEGKVDFAGVFSRLKKAGYQGPVMVECCGGKTPPEVTAAARSNREFLERVGLKSGKIRVHDRDNQAASWRRAVGL